MTLLIISERAYLILGYLCKVGLAPRSKIVAKINEPRTTVYDTLHRMRKAGLVNKIPINNKGRGRPRVFWMISKKGREVMALE